MAHDFAVLTPTNTAPARQAGKTLWRKQLVKKGKINYCGQDVVFDDAYLKDLARNFMGGAYDQVPFQLADGENKHNEDPERFRGEIKGVELTKTGLDVLVDLTPDGAKLVKDNPNLGVSARIFPTVEHADGRKFGRTIRHVLGTLDPKLTGMGSWQMVELSADDEADETIDLTNEEVITLAPEGNQGGTDGGAGTGQASSATTTSPEGGGGGDATSTATGEETVATGIAGTLSPAGGVNVNVNVNDPKPAGTSREPAPVDASLETMVFDDDDLVDALGEPVGAGVGGGGSFSNGPTEDQLRIQALELRLAEEQWHREARGFIDAGVPPALVELARPIMTLPQAPIIDLSNGSEPVDVAQTVRNILEGTKGFLEFARERGHSVATTDQQDTREQEILANWRAN